VLGLIGFVLHKRQQAASGPPLVAGQPLAPGQVPLPGQVAPPGVPVPRAPNAKKARPPKHQPQPVAPPPIVGPSLLVMSGPRNGERIPLQNGFTIGKAPGSNLVLDDGYTSSQHAQVGIDHMGSCRLYDRNSTTARSPMASGDRGSSSTTA